MPIIGAWAFTGILARVDATTERWVGFSRIQTYIHRPELVKGAPRDTRASEGLTFASCAHTAGTGVAATGLQSGVSCDNP